MHDEGLANTQPNWFSDVLEKSLMTERELILSLSHSVLLSTGNEEQCQTQVRYGSDDGESSS